MDFEIKLFDHVDTNKPPGPWRAGIWTASNVHTAVSRALTGYQREHRKGDVAHTGAHWTSLKIGEVLTIEVRRL